ncbi:hypothetical protein [Ulvibacter antarcticus]|uniref:Lipocalin-like protein n=1 Tax=Ulvibacter antarcticus TaxID=442714 RepID=A0A3L9YB67_9FLAO|nr:hypothetical protein [Ulvibacter antarcticus]RMA56717.1 hypothetical protein BXY75_3229 [Ulvibacter antarcticus]
MKNLKVLKVAFILFVAIAVFSCKDDDNVINLSDDLIGEWQRSDFNDDFEFKFVFYTNNTGIETSFVRDATGEISSLSSFNWTTEDNILTLDFDGEIETTNFSISANGQLLLSDFTDLPFDKLD